MTLPSTLSEIFIGYWLTLTGLGTTGSDPPIAGPRRFVTCFAKMIDGQLTDSQFVERKMYDRVFYILRISRKIFRLRNMFLALLALIVWYQLKFTYRMNNICAPGDHIIQSEADAIKQAQTRLFRARYGSHGIPGYIDAIPGSVDYSRTDCCGVSRTRTATGIIIWQVSLHGETIGEPKKREVDAVMWLTNCGAVFEDDSYILAEPPR